MSILSRSCAICPAYERHHVESNLYITAHCLSSSPVSVILRDAMAYTIYTTTIYLLPVAFFLYTPSLYAIGRVSVPYLWVWFFCSFFRLRCSGSFESLFSYIALVRIKWDWCLQWCGWICGTAPPLRRYFYFEAVCECRARFDMRTSCGDG